MHRTQKRPLVTGEVTPAGGADLRRRADGQLDRAARGRPRRCWPRRSRRARSSTTPSSTRWCSSGTPGAAPSSAGCPGAAPVLIGWAAVTGSLDWPAVVVFGVVFCWQMPHFWALAMRFKDDYARADVPMLPVVTTALSVGRQTVAWAWVTVAVSLLLWPVAAGYGIGLGYTIPAVAARRLVRRRGAPPARADQARRRHQADAAVPRLDLVPGAADGRDRRRRHRLRPVRRDLANARMGRAASGSTGAPTRCARSGIEPAEVEALIEAGCAGRSPTSRAGGWSGTTRRTPGRRGPTRAAPPSAVTAGRWESPDGSRAVVLVFHE